MNRTVYIDKRNRSEELDYSIAISAYDGEWGHSFVMFFWGDRVSQSSRFEGVGFYPGEADNNLKAAFGSSGVLDNDTWTNSELILSVQINKDNFDAARVVEARWRKPTPYILGINDCTSFIAEIAVSIGIATPARVLAPYPIQYMDALLQINEES